MIFCSSFCDLFQEDVEAKRAAPKASGGKNMDNILKAQKEDDAWGDGEDGEEGKKNDGAAGGEEEEDSEVDAGAKQADEGDEDYEDEEVGKKKRAKAGKKGSSRGNKAAAAAKKKKRRLTSLDDESESPDDDGSDEEFRGSSEVSSYFRDYRCEDVRFLVSRKLRDNLKYPDLLFISETGG